MLPACSGGVCGRSLRIAEAPVKGGSQISPSSVRLVTVSDASKFAVALSVDDDPVVAATRAAREACARLGGPGPTLTVMFVSPRLCTDPWSLLEVIHEELAPESLVGCTGEAIVGAGREVEGGPALSLWCARLPGATARTFRLSTDDGEEIVGWPDEIDGPDPPTPLLLLADPFTLPANVMIDEHNARGRPPIIGGLASGGTRPGEHVLFLDQDVHFDGGVGVEIPGAAILPVVSQGCAPIGPDMVITAGGGPVVGELAGEAAFDRISRVVDELTKEERRLLRQPLLAGLVINENQPEYGRGDFLVRGIHGRDPETGSVYIGEHVRVGQTFRLHVRDAGSADTDFRLALREARDVGGLLKPAAGLLFTCNGRGTHMFGTADHDAAAVDEELGIPTAGMFCNGEIGPVGGKTFLHGFTATMAVFLDEPDR